MTELKLLEQKTSYDLIDDSQKLGFAVRELKKHTILAIDLEGTSLDPHNTTILLVQIATPEKAYVFDARKVELTPLKEILSDEKILKIAQNAKFDYSHLKANTGIEIVNIFDTMLAERILTMGIRRENSLRAIAQKYLGLELAKETRETFANHIKEFTKKQLDYAASDVLVLFPIYNAQKEALKKEGLEKIANLEFKLVPVVAEMELKGFLIDVARWRQVLVVYEKKAKEVAQTIQEELRPYFKHTQTDLFGNKADVVNLNSPSQVLDALRKVGLDLPSTREGVLSQYDYPLTKMLLEYRGYEKILTAFGENLLSKINKRTKRVHPDYMQIGADTGRFACSNPNLQQIPTNSLFRECFIAASGYKLVIADYSQIELRLMAELSGDLVFLKAFKEGRDLHTLTASQMFGIPISKVDEDKRFQAKSINFGLMYGRGAKSLAVQLGVSEEKAKLLFRRYFIKYGRVRDWLENVAKEAVRMGYSTTLGGRKRYYQKANPEDPGWERQVAYIERQGKNTPIQGTSADMIKLALVYARDRFRKEGLDATPIHTVHDEIVVEVKEEQAEKTARVLEEEMRRAGEEFLKRVSIKVEAVISDVWEH